MKTNLLRLATGLAFAVLLTACPETYVPDNFGTSALSLKAADWEGNWHPADDPKEVFTFRVRDAEQGMIELQEANPKDAKKKPEIFTLSLREAGTKTDEKVHFAILKDTSKKDDGTLHLILPSKDEVFILWAINHEAVTAAIKSGELKGSILPDKDGPHNSLASDPNNYPKLLAPKFWKWTEPMVMLRVN
jgi:hypothetical protein